MCRDSRIACVHTHSRTPPLADMWSHTQDLAQAQPALLYPNQVDRPGKLMKVSSGLLKTPDTNTRRCPTIVLPGDRVQEDVVLDLRMTFVCDALELLYDAAVLTACAPPSGVLTNAHTLMSKTILAVFRGSLNSLCMDSGMFTALQAELCADATSALEDALRGPLTDPAHQADADACALDSVVRAVAHLAAEAAQPMSDNPSPATVLNRAIVTLAAHLYWAVIQACVANTPLAAGLMSPAVCTIYIDAIIAAPSSLLAAYLAVAPFSPSTAYPQPPPPLPFVPMDMNFMDALLPAPEHSQFAAALAAASTTGIMATNKRAQSPPPPKSTPKQLSPDTVDPEDVAMDTAPASNHSSPAQPAKTPIVATTKSKQPALRSITRPVVVAEPKPKPKPKPKRKSAPVEPERKHKHTRTADDSDDEPAAADVEAKPKRVRKTKTPVAEYPYNPDDSDSAIDDEGHCTCKNAAQCILRLKSYDPVNDYLTHEDFMGFAVSDDLRDHLCVYIRIISKHVRGIGRPANNATGGTRNTFATQITWLAWAWSHYLPDELNPIGDWTDPKAIDAFIKALTPWGATTSGLTLNIPPGCMGRAHIKGLRDQWINRSMGSSSGARRYGDTATEYDPYFVPPTAVLSPTHYAPGASAAPDTAVILGEFRALATAVKDSTAATRGLGKKIDASTAATNNLTGEVKGLRKGVENSWQQTKLMLEQHQKSSKEYKRLEDRKADLLEQQLKQQEVFHKQQLAIQEEDLAFRKSSGDDMSAALMHTLEQLTRNSRVGPNPAFTELPPDEPMAITASADAPDA